MDAPIYTDLSGRTAIVTGAGSCIGRAIAVEFARQNMYVSMLDISDDGLNESLATIKKERIPSNNVIPYICDVTDEKAVEGAFKYTKNKYLNIDVVVNNAGISPKENYPIADTPIDLARKLLDVNVIGYLIISKYAAQMFREQATKNEGRYEDGSIINIASNAAFGSLSNFYGVTNTARMGLTWQAALELGKIGVRVNTVVPGNVIEGSGLWRGYLDARAAAKGMDVNEAKRQYETRAPLGKICTPEHVAYRVACLASPKGPDALTHGQVIRVDSGERFGL